MVSSLIAFTRRMRIKLDWKAYNFLFQRMVLFPTMGRFPAVMVIPRWRDDTYNLLCLCIIVHYANKNIVLKEIKLLVQGD